MGSAFAKNVQPGFRILFRLHGGSLITWLLAMLASSTVKYGEQYWYFSVMTNSVALLVVFFAWIFARTQAYALGAAQETITGGETAREFGRALASPLESQVRSARLTVQLNQRSSRTTTSILSEHSASRLSGSASPSAS